MAVGKAFTLVEILIVVLILAILAAIVVPKFSNASAIARASMLADDLRIERMQLTIFKSQHFDVPAGYPGGDRNASPTEAALIAHMTKSTTADCAVAEPGTSGYNYGPYLREVPQNPINGKNSVQVLGNSEVLPASGDDSHGWIYQPSSMTLKADSPGADDKGKLYFDY